MRVRSTALVAVAILALTSCVTTADETTTPPIDPDTPIDIQGHRGARGLKPESTLPSFETALDVGVDTLEFDLHFTSDGEIVIWHDPVVSPEKCGLKPGAPDSVPDPDDPETPPEALALRALTASDLEWFDCDRNPDVSRFPDQDASETELAGDDYRILTMGALIEFVKTYADSEGKSNRQRETARAVRFNVETKRDPRDPATIGDGFDGTSAGPFELRLLDVIASHGLAERVVIQSFDDRSLRAIHAVDPSIDLALLTSSPFARFSEFADAGVSIWSPRFDTATQDAINEAHAAGLSVIPWTVNVGSEMQELAERGVDGIITDRPDIAVELFGQG